MCALTNETTMMMSMTVPRPTRSLRTQRQSKAMTMNYLHTSNTIRVCEVVCGSGAGPDDRIPENLSRGTPTGKLLPTPTSY